MFNSELTSKHMADEVLCVNRSIELEPNDSLSASTLFISFKADKDGLQSGIDLLIQRGLIGLDKHNSDDY
jgi:hypothetical protein